MPMLKVAEMIVAIDRSSEWQYIVYVKFNVGRNKWETYDFNDNKMPQMFTIGNAEEWLEEVRRDLGPNYEVRVEPVYISENVS